MLLKNVILISLYLRDYFVMQEKKVWCRDFPVVVGSGCGCCVAGLLCSKVGLPTLAVPCAPLGCASLVSVLLIGIGIIIGKN